MTFNFLVSGEIIVITRRSSELSFNRKKLIKITEKSVIVESPKNDKNPFKKSVKNEMSKLFKILEISFDKFKSYVLKKISSSLTNNIIFFSKSSICKRDKFWACVAKTGKINDPIIKKTVTRRNKVIIVKF